MKSATNHSVQVGALLGSGGSAFNDFLANKKKVNPLLLKGMSHIAGADAYEESLDLLNFEITSAPPMDRPLLIFHAGKDRLIPNGEAHAKAFIDWAVGEKELKFYPDGDHVCANHLDETDVYMIDWLNKHLAA